MTDITSVHLNKYAFGANTDVGRRSEKMNTFSSIFGSVKDTDFERCF